MVNINTMNLMEKLGFGADVDALESYVCRLQDSAAANEPEVTDTQYDMYVDLLRQLKPESVILSRNWEMEDFELSDYDMYLNRYGMKSILTIQGINELYTFKERLGEKKVRLIASVKLNGHAIRITYKNGQLVSSTKRGRRKKGRDITRIVKLIVPNYIEELAEYGLVEVRGELLLSLSKFEGVKSILKTPLSAVTSLSRDSASDEEAKLLSVSVYQIYADGIKFGTLTDKFKALKRYGFEIPYVTTVDGIDAYNLNDFVENVIAHFEKIHDSGELDYATDGIVVAVDNVEEFNSFGNEGNYHLGNFALKMGRIWESNIYSGIIDRIEYMYGKANITPKAILYPPVITRTGSEVSTVPLYNIGVMQDYKYYPGNEIYFRFGGETGVSCTSPDGKPISE